MYIFLEQQVETKEGLFGLLPVLNVLLKVDEEKFLDLVLNINVKCVFCHCGLLKFTFINWIVGGIILIKMYVKEYSLKLFKAIVYILTKGS